MRFEGSREREGERRIKVVRREGREVWSREGSTKNWERTESVYERVVARWRRR